MAFYLPNGIGGSLGDSLVTAKPLQTTGKIWYVYNTTGVDAAAPAGLERIAPLATITQAHTNAADGDLIVCLTGHAETVSSVITVSKRVAILGEGTASGIPTVTLTLGGAANNIFTITAVRAQLRNLKFKPRTAAATGSYVSTATANHYIKGCYFELDENSDGPGVLLSSGANLLHFENCTFLSTEATLAQKPDSAIRVAAALTGLRMFGCIFDGGTVGFATSASNPWAFDGNGGAITDFHFEAISLLRGADMRLDPASVGYLNVQTSSGSARVDM